MKYFYSKDTATLYYLENGNLFGAPQDVKGTFDTNEASFIDTWDATLGQERTKSNKTVASIWAEAWEALEA